MTNENKSVAAKPEGGYRILHTADWHLGKMLGEFDRIEEHQRFLTWLLAAISEQQVDALIIAGDVFDSARPPQSAVRQYFEFLAELYRATDCQVVVTAGNHDSPAHLDAPREALKALKAHVVGELPDRIEGLVIPLPSADNPQVVVAAVPFLRDRDLRTGQLGQDAGEIQRELREGITRRYAEALTACEHPEQNVAARVAVGHLTVQGAKSSDSEREIHIGGLGAVPSTVFPEEFAYVALGHLHRPQRVDESARVCYSGSPIPLSFSEAKDHKSVRLLDFAAGELVANQTLSIPVSRQLMQLKTTRHDLKEALIGAELPAADLETWVELLVDSSDVGGNIFEQAREIAKDMPFKIVKVAINRVGEQSRLADDSPSDEAIESLLDSPIDVFDRLLEQQQDLSEDEIASIRTAFAELRDLERQDAESLQVKQKNGAEHVDSARESVAAAEGVQ